MIKFVKHILFYFVLFCLFSLSGCKKNLDPGIYGSISPDEFPKTEAEWELYTIEVYKPFQAKWGYQEIEWQNNFFSYEYGYIQMFDAPTDLLTEFPEWGGFFEAFSKANFVFLKSQGRTSHFEKVRFITRITKIIDDLEKSNLGDATKIKLIAEAKMARGAVMFYLLHMYGPVPCILDAKLIGTSAESDLTRPSREKYSDAIIADLIFAAQNLEVKPSEYGRFNKGLAKVVLMRHYLYEKKYTEAEKVGRELQTMGYSLVNDYASLFREITEINSETIYAVSCQNGQNGEPGQNNINAYAFYCYPGDYPGNRVKGGWSEKVGAYMATWQFYDSFDAKDARRKLLVAKYINKNGVERNRENMRGAVIAKYPDEGGDVGSYQGNDVIIARYADVLLMLAEAINENNDGPSLEAVALVDSVRNRAGIDKLVAADYSSKEVFKEILLKERAKELYFEGLRKMDLERFGKWESALQFAGKTPGPCLFPIPDYAINNSKGILTQNEGY